MKVKALRKVSAERVRPTVRVLTEEQPYTSDVLVKKLSPEISTMLVVPFDFPLFCRANTGSHVQISDLSKSARVCGYFVRFSRGADATVSDDC